MNDLNMLFQMFLLITGIILAVLIFRIRTGLLNKCKSNTYDNCIIGLVIISVLFIISPIMLSTCKILCSNCKETTILNNMFIAIFSFILGITLTIIGSLLQNELNRNPECTGKVEAQSIMGVGIFILSVSLIYFIIKYRVKIKNSSQKMTQKIKNVSQKMIQKNKSSDIL